MRGQAGPFDGPLPCLMISVPLKPGCEQQLLFQFLSDEFGRRVAAAAAAYRRTLPDNPHARLALPSQLHGVVAGPCARDSQRADVPAPVPRPADNAMHLQPAQGADGGAAAALVDEEGESTYAPRAVQQVALVRVLVSHPDEDELARESPLERATEPTSRPRDGGASMITGAILEALEGVGGCFAAEPTVLVRVEGPPP